MSVGSWLLTAYSPAAVGSWLLAECGRLPRARRVLSLVATLLGPGIATYTAVLVADTATPAWHAARRELPFVFAASATASAGAVAGALAAGQGAPSPTAGRVAVGGALGEVIAAAAMKRTLGPLDTYRSPQARSYSRAATALSLGGATATAASLLLPGRKRALTVIGSCAVLAGSICERFAVIRAGTASADDPGSVLIQQHDRA